MDVIKALGCCAVFVFLNWQPLALADNTYPDWRGGYIGVVGGGALATFDAKTSTQTGPLLTAPQANAVNQAGNQTLSPNGFLAGATGGYNWQIKQFLFGIEGDIQSLSINETINSGAILYPDAPANQFVLTAYANENWLMTLRPRLGIVTNTGMFYVTGGLAVTLLQSDFLFSNNVGAFESQQISQFKPGMVIGAGFETGLTENVSMKLEYLYTDYGKTNAYNMNQNIPAGQTFTNSVTLKESLLRLGLNYRFNQASALSPQLLPLLFDTNQWKVEVGTRAFYSTGMIGAPQPLIFNPGNVLLSRLTFSDLTAATAEIYTRFDHNNGLFVKGILGAGSITDGQLNDEDFPAEGAYSNTLSQANGNLSFATADIGYSFLKTSTARTGFFIGYNYYAQNANIYNCQQLAQAGVCATSSAALNKFLVLSEDDNYQSMRIGLVSQFDITNRLNLTSEVAYLPLVSFNGQDNHNARQLIGPEEASSGNGSMLESVLSYQFSDYWNIGLGARYWLWNMNNGSVLFNFLGAGGPPPVESGLFNSYRYGAFLQLNYRENPVSHYYSGSSPMTWQGFYIGGNLGGSWGNSDWSDPFGPTPGDPGFTNAAGFGDNIHSTGPLGGVDIHYYWQKNNFVWGIGGSAGIADMQGQNTLFSGLGGVNGVTTTRYYLSLIGKIGLACDRSLFYLNVGPAWLNSQYTVNANTSALSLGAQNQWVWQTGVTIGAGIEYALTDQWTTNVEYDYFSMPNKRLSFSEIEVINGYTYSVNQNMNIVKLGINYKF